MTILLYDLFIRLYTLAIRQAAPFHPKARAWRDGRRRWASRLEDALRPIRAAGRPLLWMHCASLGEFEQGRPLIERLKKERPDLAILLTFFSPSGYEIRKDYPLADHVAYLPPDTRRNARRFQRIAAPDLVVFVKYEFWRHHLLAVQRRGVPLLLISALFRPGQLFFRPWGGSFLRLLTGFTHLFVQNEASAALLARHGIRHCTVAGDTRVDRVAAIAEQAADIPVVAAFAAGHHVLVAGSTWPPDEERLAGLINAHLPAGWRVIIAPHDIGAEHLRQIERLVTLPLLRYSQADAERAAAARVLLIDNIGMLASLYRYGRLAYIGGGFGAGIHNTLEPIAFGLPVLFGPRYRKFAEAVALVARGGAFPVSSTEELLRVFRQLEGEEAYREAARQARDYIDENRGATRRIADFIAARFPAR